MKSLRQKFRSVACVALCAGMSGVAFSQTINKTEIATSINRYPTYGIWHSSRIRGGGYFQDVILCPSDPMRCYTYVDMAGMYRSDDGGNMWRMLHGALPPEHALFDTRGIDVDPRNADCFVAALGKPDSVNVSGIYRTEDGGMTFTRVQAALFGGNSPHREAGKVFARSPENPDVILAASFGTGVWRSEDNGKTWTNCGVQDRWFTDIRYDKTNPMRVFLCSKPFKGSISRPQQVLSEAFFRSEDGGKTWEKISTTSPSEILQDPNDPTRFFGILDYRLFSVTKDLGVTWQQMTDGLPITDKLPDKWPYVSPQKFSALSAGPDFVIIGNANGDMWRLDKDKTRWSPVKKQKLECGDWWGNAGAKPGYVHYGKAMGSVIVDPRNQDHWFSTDWYGVWQTFDAGKNWKLTVDGAEPTYIFAMAADPRSPSVVHMGMSDNGYFRSTDGGKSFYQNVNGISTDIKNVEVCATNPDHLYAVGGSLKGHVIKWGINQVFSSTDAGLSWKSSEQVGLPDGREHYWNTIVADPRDENHVFLAVSGKPEAGAGGVYESRDGGSSWQWIGQGLPADKDIFFRKSIWTIGREIAVSADGSMVALSSDRGVVYRRNKNGGEWVKSLDLKGMPFEIAANPKDNGIFIVTSTQNGVYLTTDGGKNWSLTFAGNCGRMGWDYAGKRVAVSTNDGMILSHDGGRTWEQMDKKLPDRRLHNMAAFAGNRLIIGSGASGVFWADLNP